MRPDKTIGYRCPSEPVENYLRKGGRVEETVGRKCVCNGLPSTVGSAQTREDGTSELPLVTAGNDVSNVAQFLAPGRSSYTAADVITMLLEEPAEPCGSITTPAEGQMAALA